MNYIYDITLNFNKELNNFYEWDENDNVDFYLKIPIFKVEEDIIKDFITCDFKVDKLFLSKIENKTDIYGKNSIKKNKYSAIFTNSNIAVAVIFNDIGESILKSYLSIDEEIDVLEYSKSIKYSIINYKITNKKRINYFITRNENKNKIKLVNSLKRIYKLGEYQKLKYIYFEIYDEKSDNYSRMYSKLINLVENNSEKLNEINNIIEKTDKYKSDIKV